VSPGLAVLAETVELVKIQQATGKTVKRIVVRIEYAPQGKTVVEASWPVPRAAKVAGRAEGAR
jgi:hypothetical protein